MATARLGGAVPSVASTVRVGFEPGINVSLIPPAIVIIALAGGGVVAGAGASANVENGTDAMDTKASSRGRIFMTQE